MKTKKLLLCMVMACLSMLLWRTEASAGDDFSSAQQISVNTNVSGNVTKGSGYEKKYYKFDISVPGAVTVNVTTPLQSNSDSYWKVFLYNSEYNEITSEEIKGNKSTTEFTTIGLDKGTYYINIHSAISYEAASTDMYTICVKYSQSDMLEKEFNEDFTSSTPISVNNTYSGTIRHGYNYEKDYYVFNTSADGVISLCFSNPLQSKKDNYWNVVIYNGEYKELLSQEISGAYQSVNLPSLGIPSGTYYIKITSTIGYEAASTDTYSIAVNYTASSQWEKEINNDYTTATSINMNLPYYGVTVNGSNYDSDYYCISIPDSGYYSAVITTPNLQNGDTFWRMYLYNASYDALESVDVKGNETVHYILQYLNSGTYYIKVCSSSGYSAESYEPYNIKVIPGSVKSNTTATSTKVKKVKPAKVTWKKAKGHKYSVSLSWKKAKNAEGYAIYMATKKNGKYKLISNTSYLSYYKYYLKNNKNYYFKVRAYRYNGSKICYGKYSKIKKVKTKK